MNPDNLMTPLELLNLYLTDGKSIGSEESKLYQKFNCELTWDALLNEGYQQDLAPMLYYIITKTSVLKTWQTHKPELGTYNPQLSIPQSFGISDEIKSKLKLLYHQFLVRNMIQFKELDTILDAFERKEIDVIQLKGAWLAKNYYPDPALRPMADLDLLVRKEDMKRAKESLMAQGYEFNGIFPFMSEDSYEKAHFHFPYRKNDSSAPIFVELHQDIAAKSDSVKNNIQDFWGNASLINKDHKKNVLTVPKEYFLLHLFWHTFHNLSGYLYFRFIWLLDIAHIINKHTNYINWLFIEKKATEWRIQKQVYFCLYLVSQLFFDNKITKTLMPANSSKKIFNSVMLKMENNTLALNDPNRFLIILLNLLSLNTFNERIKYLFRYNYYKNPLNKKDWVGTKYKITSKKLIYLFLIINPIISILKVFKGLYGILLVSHQNKYKGKI
jgi:hypothetical protein